MSRPAARRAVVGKYVSCPSGHLTVAEVSTDGATMFWNNGKQSWHLIFEGSVMREVNTGKNGKFIVEWEDEEIQADVYAIRYIGPREPQEVDEFEGTRWVRVQHDEEPQQALARPRAPPGGSMAQTLQKDIERVERLSTESQPDFGPPVGSWRPSAVENYAALLVALQFSWRKRKISLPSVQVGRKAKPVMLAISRGCLEVAFWNPMKKADTTYSFSMSEETFIRSPYDTFTYTVNAAKSTSGNSGVTLATELESGGSLTIEFALVAKQTLKMSVVHSDGIAAAVLFDKVEPEQDEVLKRRKTV